MTQVRGQDLLREAVRLLGTRKLYEALQFFNAAEAAGAPADECSAGRWDCYMLSGSYEMAWRESDAIDARGGVDPNRFWDGKPLRGKSVIVRCLHGLGDTLQFMRFLPRIRGHARALTLEVQPQLVSLLKESFQIHPLGVDRLMTWGDPEPAWDAQIEINEVPRILRVNQTDLPVGVPYISIGHRATRTPIREALRVGLVWGAGDFNPARSIRAALLDSLSEIPGARFFSLQGGKQQSEIARWNGQITGLTHSSSSILDLARFMTGLDLVVTVDTMAAHLAGALGLPTWILLHYASDWRWMLDRTDTPWYPSARLFRQSSPNDWGAVVREVQNELITTAGQALSAG